MALPLTVPFDLTFLALAFVPGVAVLLTGLVVTIVGAIRRRGPSRVAMRLRFIGFGLVTLLPIGQFVIWSLQAGLWPLAVLIAVGFGPLQALWIVDGIRDRVSGVDE